MKQDSKQSSDNQSAVYGYDSQEALIRYNFPNHAKQLSDTSEESFPQPRTSSMLFDFLRKKKAEQAAQSKGPTDAPSDPNDKYRGNKVGHMIDPTDGKTMTCNRARTFDSFVGEQQLGEVEQQKKVGHGWEILRAVAKLKAPFKKGLTKGKNRASGQHSAKAVTPRLLC